MIPKTYKYIKPQYAALRAQVVQGAPAATNIQSIAYYGRTPEGEKIWKMTVAAVTAPQFVTNMKVTNASTTGGKHDGTFRIWKVDVANDIIYYINSSVNSEDAQTGVAGTATPDGISPFGVWDEADMEVLRNNNNTIVGYLYSAEKYFYANNYSEWNQIQVIVTTGTSVKVKFEKSLDGVNWADLDTDIDVAVSSNTVFSFKDELKDLFIRIHVHTLTDSPKYYVIAR